MLDGYTHLSQLEEVLDFVILLLKEIRDIYYVTVRLMLHSSAGLLGVELGKQVHGYSYRHEKLGNILDKALGRTISSVCCAPTSVRGQSYPESWLLLLLKEPSSCGTMIT
ncbi:hypothetical protein POM88_006370 [Heracleum sosnowskyi]|uniref:Uncharacterized protein n=1 Tax=Heracleum sosnowskyi TaxID=360622 RepID=A0AAD8J5V5_9APIA|nr:hypothetical protein POM88_006370 [Heracleum sosnowskyi]